MTPTNLVNMELSAAEAKELSEPCAADPPKYPWGLQLQLTEEQLAKLGLGALPAVGTSMQLTARVEVCATSERDSQDGGARRSLELQVTDMALTADAPARPDKAAGLYPTMRAKR